MIEQIFEIKVVIRTIANREKSNNEIAGDVFNALAAQLSHEMDGEVKVVKTSAEQVYKQSR